MKLFTLSLLVLLIAFNTAYRSHKAEHRASNDIELEDAVNKKNEQREAEQALDEDEEELDEHVNDEDMEYLYDNIADRVIRKLRDDQDETSNKKSDPRAWVRVPRFRIPRIRIPRIRIPRIRIPRIPVPRFTRGWGKK